MGCTVRYGQKTKAARMQAALSDAKGYLGDLYPKVEGYLQEVLHVEGRKGFAKLYPIMLSFAGLQGAPARAMALEVLRHR